MTTFREIEDLPELSPLTEYTTTDIGKMLVLVRRLRHEAVNLGMNGDPRASRYVDWLQRLEDTLTSEAMTRAYGTPQ